MLDLLNMLMKPYSDPGDFMGSAWNPFIV